MTLIEQFAKVHSEKLEKENVSPKEVKHGGKRDGAGRPVADVKAEKFTISLSESGMRALEQLIEFQEGLAAIYCENDPYSYREENRKKLSRSKAIENSLVALAWARNMGDQTTHNELVKGYEYRVKESMFKVK